AWDRNRSPGSDRPRTPAPTDAPPDPRAPCGRRLPPPLPAGRALPLPVGPAPVEAVVAVAPVVVAPSVVWAPPAVVAPPAEIVRAAAVAGELLAQGKRRAPPAPVPASGRWESLPPPCRLPGPVSPPRCPRRAPGFPWWPCRIPARSGGLPPPPGRRD